MSATATIITSKKRKRSAKVSSPLGSSPPLPSFVPPHRDTAFREAARRSSKADAATLRDPPALSPIPEASTSHAQ